MKQNKKGLLPSVTPSPFAAPTIGQGEAFTTEEIPDDYRDRKGYDPLFLGVGLKVRLPVITDELLKEDILTFSLEGKKEHLLHYRHFSVMMSKSRRLCLYSAVNIDGKTAVPLKRRSWRLDPRIPPQTQIMKECYGAAPKFSRGHMTRREDPIWGEAEEAAQGNVDSMHVTNTVPQVQGMNAGIWLKLENYALQNAKKDDMRISVFTGPVFTGGDPVQFGVNIPLAFWKVIIFIHDETGQLCATGYRISQKLQSEEGFIFGAHNCAQVSIASIEKETGLSFGELAGLDPFTKKAQALSTEPARPAKQLRRLRQIQFV